MSQHLRLFVEVKKSEFSIRLNNRILLVLNILILSIARHLKVILVKHHFLSNFVSTALIRLTNTGITGRKEMVYLMMHSTHFYIYGYMASDILW